jgi:hypothetical protein
MSRALSTLPKRAVPAGVDVPRVLLIAAVVVALQAVAGLAYGVYLMLAGVLWHPISVGRAEGAGVIVLVMGAGLALVAFGLTRSRRWARTPAAMVQTFGLWASYYILQAGLYPVGALVIVACVATLVLLFLPRATRSFIHE